MGKLRGSRFDPLSVFGLVAVIESVLGVQSDDDNKSGTMLSHCRLQTH